MNEVTPHTANLPQTTYKPSEIIGIYNSILAKQSVNAQVVYLHGVYLASERQPYGGYFYDTLRDEDRQEEITIYLTQQQRESLKMVILKSATKPFSVLIACTCPLITELSIN